MAWRDRWCNMAAGVGGADGSEDNDWSWAQAIAGALAGDYIWTKGSLSAAAGYGLSIAGVVADNSQIVFHGYNTTYGDASAGNFVGDMNFGQAYYQSPLDAYINGINATKCVPLSGAGVSDTLLDFTGGINITFKHFHLTGVNTAANRLLAFTGNPPFTNGLLFDRCWFSSCYQIVNNSALPTIGVKFHSCFMKNDVAHNQMVLESDGSELIGCVFNPVATKPAVVNAGSMIAAYNLFVGGGEGLRNYDELVAFNNTFYNQDLYCINAYNASGPLTFYNNILVPAVGASDYGGYIRAPAGTILHSDYNCYYAADGAITTPIYNGDQTEEIAKGPNSIEADPLFVDAANNDFRLKPGSPCLNTGRPNIMMDNVVGSLNRGFTSMGAFQALQRYKKNVHRIGV